MKISIIIAVPLSVDIDNPVTNLLSKFSNNCLALVVIGSLFKGHGVFTSLTVIISKKSV